MMQRMSRKEIQALAKLHRVQANLKTEAIIEAILIAMSRYQSEVRIIDGF